MREMNFFASLRLCAFALCRSSIFPSKSFRFELRFGRDNAIEARELDAEAALGLREVGIDAERVAGNVARDNQVAGVAVREKLAKLGGSDVDVDDGLDAMLPVGAGDARAAIGERPVRHDGPSRAAVRVANAHGDAGIGVEEFGKHGGQVGGNLAAGGVRLGTEQVVYSALHQLPPQLVLRAVDGEEGDVEQAGRAGDAVIVRDVRLHAKLLHALPDGGLGGGARDAECHEEFGVTAVELPGGEAGRRAGRMVGQNGVKAKLLREEEITRVNVEADKDAPDFLARNVDTTVAGDVLPADEV
jgi:hypothetical protein